MATLFAVNSGNFYDSNCFLYAYPYNNNATTTKSYTLNTNYRGDGSYISIMNYNLSGIALGGSLINPDGNLYIKVDTVSGDVNGDITMLYLKGEINSNIQPYEYIDEGLYNMRVTYTGTVTQGSVTPFYTDNTCGSITTYKRNDIISSKGEIIDALLDTTSDATVIITPNFNSVKTKTFKNYYSTVNSVLTSLSSPFGGDGSLYFDGNSYLTIPSDAMFNPVANEDFTIELWVYPTESGTAKTLIGAYTGYWNIRLDSNMRVVGYISGDFSSEVSLLLNKWNHIAVTRLGIANNNVTVYVNGISKKFTQTGSAGNSASSPNLIIGASTTGTQIFKGYLSNLRILRNECAYPVDFANATLIPYADVRSVKFNGSDSYLLKTTATDLDIKNNTFTIQLWFNVQVQKRQCIISFDRGFMVWIGTDNQIYVDNYNSKYVKSGTALTLKKWYHLCVTKDSSGNIYIYVNGILSFSANSTNCPIANATTPYLLVGADFTNSSDKTNRTNYFNGYICDVRVLVGSELVEIPIYPLTDITNTKLLTLQTDPFTENFWKNINDYLNFLTPLNTYNYIEKSTSAVVNPAPTNVILGTTDFTIQFFAYFPDSLASQSGMVYLYTYGNMQLRFGDSANGDKLQFCTDVTNAKYIYSIGSYTKSNISKNSWYHICITRCNGAIRVFLNGDKVGISGVGVNPFRDANNHTIYQTKVEVSNDIRLFDQKSTFFNYGSYLEIQKTGSDSLLFGLNNFTVECFIYPTKAGNGQGELIYGTGGSNTDGFIGMGLVGNADGMVFYACNKSGGTKIRANTTKIPYNQWTHVALCRSGNDFSLFVNGIYNGKMTIANYNVTLDGPVIGNNPSKVEGTECLQSVYISNFRIVNTTALYTSNFQVPTSPLGSISNTAFLLNIDESPVYQISNNTNYVSKPVAIGDKFIGNISQLNIVKNCQYSDSFGSPDPNTTLVAGSIGELKGDFVVGVTRPTVVASTSTPYDGTIYATPNTTPTSLSPLTITDNTTFLMANKYDSWYCIRPSGPYDFYGDDFTIEWWSKPFKIDNNLLGNIGNKNLGYYLYRIGDSFVLKTKNKSITLTTDDSYTSPPLNEWRHYALSRKSGNLRFHVNGNKLYDDVVVDLIKMDNPYVPFNVASNAYLGYWSNTRVISQSAAYGSSNFTKPTTPAKANEKTTLLLNFNNAPIVDAKKKNNINAPLRGVQLFNFDSPFFNDYDGFWSGYFDGSSRIIFNTGNFSGSTDFKISAWIYPTEARTDQAFLHLGDNSASSILLYMGAANDLKVRILTNTGVVRDILTYKFIDLFKWTYVTLSRKNNVLYIFINGKIVFSEGNITFTIPKKYLTIGAFYTGAYIGVFKGYIYNVELDADGYNANFDVPTSPHGSNNAQYFLGVMGKNLLHNWDNAYGGWTPIENYGVGNSFNNPFIEINPNSCDNCGYFDGRSYMTFDNCTLPNSLSACDFTYEAFFKMHEYLKYNHITSHLFVYDNGASFQFRSDDTVLINTSITKPLALNSWHHIAVTRKNFNYTLWINGKKISNSKNLARTYKFDNLNIGSDLQDPQRTSTNGFKGLISNFRFTLNLARYDYAQSVYDVPTSTLDWNGGDREGTDPFTPIRIFADGSLSNPNSEYPIYNIGRAVDNSKFGSGSLRNSKKVWGLEFIWDPYVLMDLMDNNNATYECFLYSIDSKAVLGKLPILSKMTPFSDFAGTSQWPMWTAFRDTDYRWKIRNLGAINIRNSNPNYIDDISSPLNQDFLINEWVHYAITVENLHDGTYNVILYVNGQLNGSVIIKDYHYNGEFTAKYARAFLDQTVGTPWEGKPADYSASYPYFCHNGWMDEIIITKKIKYSGNFTPPTKSASTSPAGLVSTLTTTVPLSILNYPSIDDSFETYSNNYNLIYFNNLFVTNPDYSIRIFYKTDYDNTFRIYWAGDLSNQMFITNRHQAPQNGDTIYIV